MDRLINLNAILGLLLPRHLCQTPSPLGIQQEPLGSEWAKLIDIDRSTASRLLRGERPLNTTLIRNTAKSLHLVPELWL